MAHNDADPPASYPLDYAATWDIVQYSRHGDTQLRLVEVPTQSSSAVHAIVLTSIGSHRGSQLGTFSISNVHAYNSDNGRRIRFYSWADPEVQKGLRLFWDLQFQEQKDLSSWCGK